MQISKLSLLRALASMLALVAMCGVFMLYLQPDFMVRLSNQVWGCF